MTEVCRSCKQPIRWALSVNERPIPLDAQPHPEGNLRVVAGHAFSVPPEARSAFPGQLYRAHFASCPEADQHRR